jgi:HEAT repeat protein
MNKHLAAVIFGSFGLAIVSAGCQGAGGGAGGGPEARAKPMKRVTAPPPREAPPAPPRVDVAIDPTLMTGARQLVTRSLQSSDPLLRSQAVEALRSAPDAQATNQIISALGDRDRGVRFGAAMMAGELGLKQAYPKLKLLANDPDASVDLAALFALHKLGDTTRSQEIGRAALSQDATVRRNAALVLGMLGERSAIDRILRRLRVDEDPIVRQQALEAMWRLGDQDAIKPLVALTASQYADDKIIGVLALAAPRRQLVREHVRGLLASDAVQLEVSLVAARAMGMLGSDEGYAIAKDAVGSKDPQQRFLAALALGSIGRSDAQDELKQLMADPIPNVQLAAATALLQLQQGQRQQSASSVP